MIAGVDGCPGGWLMVHHPLGQPSKANWQVFETFKQLLEQAEDYDAIAVDIPIGLPDTIEKGGRGPDREARAVLGDRQSAVFSIPARSAVYCESYRDACEIALRHSDPPRKISKQAFNIFPKVREVDTLMTPKLQNRLIECHPEVAFWAMNGKTALTEPKKVKSKPYPPGLALRRELLSTHGFSEDFLAGPSGVPRRIAAIDDFLDACAACWTAGRLAQGRIERFPPEPQHDTKGLRIEICY